MAKKPQTITRNFFDYNALPDNSMRAKLRGHAGQIRLLLKRSARDIWDIGSHLTQVKEVLNHGDFGKWIDAEFGLSERTARNFMAVYTAFKSATVADLEALSPRILYALASPSVDDETREVALEMAASGDLKTAADATALIEAAKPIEDSNPVEFDGIGADENTPGSEEPKVANPPPLEWVALSQERPAEDEWVETAIFEDGQIKPISEGFVDAEENSAWRHTSSESDETSEWPITHWRALPLTEVEEATRRASDDAESDDEDPFAEEADEPATEKVAPKADDEPEPPRVQGPLMRYQSELENRASNAIIIHDTLPKPEDSKAGKTPEPEPMSDDEWLESLPIYRVLKGKTHRAITLRRALLDFRHAEKAIGAYSRAIASAESVKAGDANFFARAFAAPRTITTPDNWGICAPCAGNGCTRCGQAGFEMSGGIDPRRVEVGEVSL